MRLERLTKYLLQHRWQTYGLTFLISFVPVFGILGILIAGLVTLRKSIVEGAILTLIAALPFVVTYLYMGNVNEFTVAVLSYVLTWVYAVMLQRGSSWSELLQVAALFGAMVISVVHLIYPDVGEWWETQLLFYYKQAAEMIANFSHKPVGALTEAQIEAISFSKQYMTGITVAVVLFNAISQLIVARWWETAVFARGMLRKELHNIRLLPLAGVLFAIGMVFAYLGNAVVLDIMPVLDALFAAAGLSLVHYLIGLMKSSSKWFWVCVLYISLLLGFPTSIALLAILGLIDIWVDMRKRLQKI